MRPPMLSLVRADRTSRAGLRCAGLYYRAHLEQDSWRGWSLTLGLASVGVPTPASAGLNSRIDHHTTTIGD
jgi:hypothetical protein